MLSFPAHACFFLRPKPGQRPLCSARAFAKALGAELLVLESASRAGKAAALQGMTTLLARTLAQGREVAIETSGLRKEELGRLRNLVKRAYFTPVELDLDDLTPADDRPLEIARVFPDTWRPWLRGPFDIIGDIHDCAAELMELLDKLGYRVTGDPSASEGTLTVLPHHAGRSLVFLGDFTDRGPTPIATLRLVIAAARSGALAVIGNHDKRLREFLEGRRVHETDWFTKTARATASLSPDERRAIATYLARLPSHLVLDDEALVVAHAGCRSAMQGRDNEYVSEFCMYGESGGTLDKDGYPIRIDWAADYEGSATVVYGHVTTPTPRWNAAGNAVCIDTGCCLGGALTALRWPERTLVSVAARRVYTRLAGFPRGARAPAGAKAALT